MGSAKFQSEYIEKFEGEYNFFLPDKNGNHPLLIYLHVYKSEYVLPDLMKDQIPEGLIENSDEFNFILACPLCPFGFYWRTTICVFFR